MSQTISIQLHREDETRIVVCYEDNSVHIFQIEPVSDDGQRFFVTMADETVRTPWCTTQTWGYEWGCHSDAGGYIARLREYHDERSIEDVQGDTLPIRVVLAWLWCRAEAKAEGVQVRSIPELARAARVRDAQMNRVLPDEPNIANTFLAQHSARRCGRNS